MIRLFAAVFVALRCCFKIRATLQLENIALRHQINVLSRSQRGRVRLRKTDRIFWTWLLCLCPDWRSALVIVKPLNRDRLASPRAPAVLDLEEPPRTARQTRAGARYP